MATGTRFLVPDERKWEKTQVLACSSIKMNTCVYDRIWQQQKELFIPINHFKNIQRSWIPAVFRCWVKIWKLFIWISCCVSFSSSLLCRLVWISNRWKSWKLKMIWGRRRMKEWIPNSRRQSMYLNIITFVASSSDSAFAHLRWCFFIRNHDDGMEHGKLFKFVLISWLIF